jgi:hypothetical protein
MPRNKVDDNQNNTCSYGLHFCSEGYLKHFGGARTVIVKINPRDVVSIPNDYNQTKGRTCRYEVIGEVGVNPDDAAEFDKPVQENANNNTYVAPKPVTKTGDSDFYRGYTDGYENKGYRGSGKDYSEGYDKGFNDIATGHPRYQYKEKPASGLWPQSPSHY